MADDKKLDKVISKLTEEVKAIGELSKAVNKLPNDIAKAISNSNKKDNATSNASANYRQELKEIKKYFDDLEAYLIQNKNSIKNSKTGATATEDMIRKLMEDRRRETDAVIKACESFLRANPTANKKDLDIYKERMRGSYQVRSFKEAMYNVNGMRFAQHMNDDSAFKKFSSSSRASIANKEGATSNEIMTGKSILKDNDGAYFSVEKAEAQIFNASRDVAKALTEQANTVRKTTDEIRNAVSPMINSMAQSRIALDEMTSQFKKVNTQAEHYQQRLGEAVNVSKKLDLKTPFEQLIAECNKLTGAVKGMKATVLKSSQQVGNASTSLTNAAKSSVSSRARARRGSSFEKQEKRNAELGRQKGFIALLIPALAKLFKKTPIWDILKILLLKFGKNHPLLAGIGLTAGPAILASLIGGRFMGIKYGDLLKGVFGGTKNTLSAIKKTGMGSVGQFSGAMSNIKGSVTRSKNLNSMLKYLEGEYKLASSELASAQLNASKYRQLAGMHGRNAVNFRQKYLNAPIASQTRSTYYKRLVFNEQEYKKYDALAKKYESSVRALTKRTDRYSKSISNVTDELSKLRRYVKANAKLLAGNDVTKIVSGLNKFHLNNIPAIIKNGLKNPFKGWWGATKASATVLKGGAKAIGKTALKGAKLLGPVGTLLTAGFEIPDIVRAFKTGDKKKGWEQVGASSGAVIGSLAGFAIGGLPGAIIGDILGRGLGRGVAQAFMDFGRVAKEMGKSMKPLVHLFGSAFNALKPVVKIIGGAITNVLSFIGKWLMKGILAPFEILGRAITALSNAIMRLPWVRNKLNEIEERKGNLGNAYDDSVFKETEESKKRNEALTKYINMDTNWLKVYKDNADSKGAFGTATNKEKLIKKIKSDENTRKALGMENVKLDETTDEELYGKAIAYVEDRLKKNQDQVKRDYAVRDTLGNFTGLTKGDVSLQWTSKTKSGVVYKGYSQAGNGNKETTTFDGMMYSNLAGAQKFAKEHGNIGTYLSNTSGNGGAYEKLSGKNFEVTGISGDKDVAWGRAGSNLILDEIGKKVGHKFAVTGALMTNNTVHGSESEHAYGRAFDTNLTEAEAKKLTEKGLIRRYVMESNGVTHIELAENLYRKMQRQDAIQETSAGATEQAASETAEAYKKQIEMLTSDGIRSGLAGLVGADTQKNTNRTRNLIFSVTDVTGSLGVWGITQYQNSGKKGSAV